MKAINWDKLDIAVVIPCYNEELTIEKVISDFRQQLPSAKIIVFDNNSTDNSYQLAIQTGVEVIKEKRQGKGYVVAALLAKVDADFYVMVDGDDTYPAEEVHKLLEPLILEQADMVVGQRLSNYSEEAFRSLHRTGNRVICRLINSVFSTRLTDPMSGYRSFTREIADNLPIVASGFDVETEMTLQLLYRAYIIKEVEIPYRARPAGSESKLRTFRDGFIVVTKIVNIFKAYKPLTFFGSLASIFALFGIFLGYFVISEYILYQYIYSVPKAILATGCMLIAMNLISVGLILSTLKFRLLEVDNVLTKQILRYRSDRSNRS
jgi:glycosyltransferase involved in cell wall biosynthesis